MAAVDTVVFDLGGVLLDWDPRHLYRTIFDDEAEMERFLAEVVAPGWNHELDLGRPFPEAVDELVLAHPEHADAIGAYWHRWDEMVPGDVPDTVEVLQELAAARVPVYGLTNFSAETFPRMAARFPWLALLRGVLVSGEEGIGKPDPAAYRMLASRFGIDLRRALFVDDLQPNVDGAIAVGMLGHRFTGSAALRAELRRLELLG